MLGLKLNHVSKRGHRSAILNTCKVSIWECYSDVKWALRCLKSSVMWLFIRQFVLANSKEIITNWMTTKCSFHQIWIASENLFAKGIIGLKIQMLEAQIQLSAFITWYNLTWCYIQNCSDGSRTRIKVWTPNRHPYLALMGELWDVYYEDFGNWLCYNGTTLYFSSQRFYITFVILFFLLGTYSTYNQGNIVLYNDAIFFSHLTYVIVSFLFKLSPICVTKHHSCIVIEELCHVCIH